MGAGASASPLGSRRAPATRPGPQPPAPGALRGVALLFRPQTHGRARGTRPDRRQAEHRRVAGQGKARAALACAPPGGSSLSYVRPPHLVHLSKFFKVIFTDLERHDSVLSSLSDEEISLGNYSVFSRSPNVPGMGFPCPTTWVFWGLCPGVPI